MLITLILQACSISPEQSSNQAENLITIGSPDNAFIIEANNFFQQQDCDSALLFIDASMADRLSPSDIVAVARITSFCYQQNAEHELALQSLQSEALLDLWPKLPPAIQLEIGQTRASLLDILDQPIDSARLYIAIAPLAEDPLFQQELFMAAWGVLAQARREQIKAALDYPEDPIRPWLELASIARDNEAGIDYQLQQVFLWQERWAEHPISQQLPQEFTELQNLARNQPKSIALLVPLSGKLADTGKAIRDGFITGLYQQFATTGSAPSLRIFDSASGDFLSTYETIINSDVEFIVGPLEKENVRLLFDLLDLPKPTLALNQIKDYGQPSANLYQFALDAEEEARQLAFMARTDGHQRVLLLGSNTLWAQRSIKAFQEEWRNLGGEVGNIEIFQQPKNYSRKVEQLLELDKSHSRARKIQDTIGKIMNYTPRRRKDVDAIILFANPKQGRALNPLFAFHYANDLPVYASSRIFDGKAIDKKNQDLKGIQFLDMPWLLDSPQLREQLLKLADTDYSRMQAFGVDAFMIYPRLPLLAALPQARLPGETGLLSLNLNREIQRELAWAQFTDSTVKNLARKKLNDQIVNEQQNIEVQEPTSSTSSATQGLDN